MLFVFSSWISMSLSPKISVLFSSCFLTAVYVGRVHDPRQNYAGCWFGCHFLNFPSHILEISNHPNWRSHIFQRGSTQPPTSGEYVDCFEDHPVPSNMASWDISEPWGWMFQQAMELMTRRQMGFCNPHCWLLNPMKIPIKILLESHWFPSIPIKPLSKLMCSPWSHLQQPRPRLGMSVLSTALRGESLNSRLGCAPVQWVGFLKQLLGRVFDFWGYPQRCHHGHGRLKDPLNCR